MIVACVFATHVEQQQCVTGKLPIRMKKSKMSVLLKGTERNKMMNGQNRRLIHRRNCFEGPNRPNPDLYEACSCRREMGQYKQRPPGIQRASSMDPCLKEQRALYRISLKRYFLGCVNPRPSYPRPKGRVQTTGG